MEATTFYESARGLQLSSVAWLLDHHLTKAAERRRIVDDLALRPGDVVLDSACGPGFWVKMFAEKVSPGGKVVGLDFSPDLLDYALASLEQAPLAGAVDLVLGDLQDLPFRPGSFDAVFIGNSFCYFREIPELLDAHKRVTRGGGRVISKEFDGGTVIFHPLDPCLTLRVVSAAAHALEDDPTPRFDNFVGRKMQGLFLRTGFQDVSTRSYAIQKVAPLAPEAKRYLAGNAGWYGRLAVPYISDEDRQRWEAAFDPGSQDYILDREDFYFCMVETVTEGTVGRASATGIG
ncbi:MAG: methyltransferase domain-containing protein [Actinomycetota bacterium]|nr:methyltransferase domain-containing protein [Actinomycetota bacterium]